MLLATLDFQFCETGSSNEHNMDECALYCLSLYEGENSDYEMSFPRLTSNRLSRYLDRKRSTP